MRQKRKGAKREGEGKRGVVAPGGQILNPTFPAGICCPI
jgi:hypothetical protein